MERVTLKWAIFCSFIGGFLLGFVITGSVWNRFQIVPTNDPLRLMFASDELESRIAGQSARAPDFSTSRVNFTVSLSRKPGMSFVPMCASDIPSVLST